MRAKKIISSTKQQVADTLKLPKDLARGEALVSIMGRSEVFIENYKGILECAEHQVVIASGDCKIMLQGKNLNIAYYTDEEMKIQGSIQTISFV